jgi:ABC-type phosphate/phosphonate transport system substrate-binding protein
MRLPRTVQLKFLRLIGAGLLMSMFCFSASTLAQSKLVIGITTSVGDTTGLIDVRENFAPLSNAIANALKATVTVSAVSPTLVQGSFEQNGFDVMLVLTSDGWRAQNQHGWKIITLSDDSEGNVVTLIRRSGAKVNSLSDLKDKKIASSGTFTRDVLMALLKQNGITPQPGSLSDARDPEALVYFLSNSFADVVAVRDPGLIKKLTAAGGVAFFKTEQIPVYAVMANSKMSFEQLDKIKQALTSFAIPPVFSQRTKIKAFKPLNSDHSVALSLFD